MIRQNMYPDPLFTGKQKWNSRTYATISYAYISSGDQSCIRVETNADSDTIENMRADTVINLESGDYVLYCEGRALQNGTVGKKNHLDLYAQNVNGTYRWLAGVNFTNDLDALQPAMTTFTIQDSENKLLLRIYPGTGKDSFVQVGNLNIEKADTFDSNVSFFYGSMMQRS